MRYIIVGTINGNFRNTYFLILGSSLNGIQETAITEGMYERTGVAMPLYKQAIRGTTSLH